MEVPTIYVREDGKIVAKEALLVEHQCWWCHNSRMYQIRQPGTFAEEIVWYQCPNCEAREDRYSKNFRSGKGKKA